MEEVWKDIYYIDSIPGKVVDYRGIYQVSNYCRIKALERRVDFGRSYRIIKEHLLDQHLKGTCLYKRVCLSKDNKVLSFTAHRIGAHVFIPNPNNYPCVNHKDEDKTNNFIWVNPDGSVDLEKSNLEWCSFQYNTVYGEGLNTRVERLKEGYKNGTIEKKMKKPIFQCDLDGNVIKRWDSLDEAAKALGTTLSNISGVLTGKPHHKTAAGFKWKYAS